MIRGAALAATALLLCTGPARAEDSPQTEPLLTGTLKAIHDRGAILLGLRDNVVPFSFKNPAGQPVGFSVDLCHAIAEDAAAALGQDLLEPGAPAWQQGIRIAYVPVAAADRLPMVASGQVDLECGSTTATGERARTVAFSPVFFLAGTKLLVRADSPAASYQDLAGKTVAVAAGTTNADVVRPLATTPPLHVLQVPSVDAGYDALATGHADALASDDILLAGVIRAHPGETQFHIVGDFLSFEPYALMFRRDDPAFDALVHQGFARRAEAGTLTTLYARWFTAPLPNGQSMNLPISTRLQEMYRALGQPD